MDRIIANNIKAIMEEKNISQISLAIDTGISNVTINRYLNNSRTIPATAFVKMAEALGVTVLDIMNKDKDNVVFAYIEVVKVIEDNINKLSKDDKKRIIEILLNSL